MTKCSIGLSPPLQQYLLDASLRESDLLRELREETSTLAEANMQIAPDQGQFMALLIELIDARKVLEIGTFTGYSSLVMVNAMASDGQVTTCDVSEQWTGIARRYWARAGVEDRIDLKLGPALETMSGLTEKFDLIFIDADKTNYVNYYEQALRLTRPGGLIVVDNVLWSGRVADPHAQDPDTQSIRELNRLLKDDPRISLSLLPIADGLTLARKRP